MRETIRKTLLVAIGASMGVAGAGLFEYFAAKESNIDPEMLMQIEMERRSREHFVEVQVDGKIERMPKLFKSMQPGANPPTVRLAESAETLAKCYMTGGVPFTALEYGNGSAHGKLLIRTEEVSSDIPINGDANDKIAILRGGRPCPAGAYVWIDYAGLYRDALAAREAEKKQLAYEAAHKVDLTAYKARRTELTQAQ